MNPKILQDCIDASLHGRMNFGEIAQLLLLEGVESYHVDLIRMENRYYASNGESWVGGTGLIANPISDTFSTEKVQAAVRGAQGGKLMYPQFVEAMFHAGCGYYVAYLTGKKVVYYGRKGEAHTEYFPGSQS